ncbi:dihydroneopterin aldolase [Thorsellia kenyensis]|uniref:7,8-dihydroneopterin aldolase n=1 Tax=Thorsellia kenyensis TaxID=1549888 RepID=A0ABV6CCP8_9GAMM
MRRVITPEQLKFFDTVFIESLVALATIGIYDWEKEIKQRLELDIVMYWDNQKGGNSDDVNDCLDYAAISQCVLDYINQRQFGLIERVAEEIAKLLVLQYQLPAVEVTVKKPTAVPSAMSVGVSVFRTLQAYQ